MKLNENNEEKQKKLPSYQRKNPRSAEQEQLKRQEKNAARPKQTFVEGIGWVRGI